MMKLVGESVVLNLLMNSHKMKKNSKYRAFLFAFSVDGVFFFSSSSVKLSHFYLPFYFLFSWRTCAIMLFRLPLPSNNFFYSFFKRLDVTWQNLYLPTFYYFPNFIFHALFPHTYTHKHQSSSELAFFTSVHSFATWPILKMRHGYVMRLKYKYVNVI